jgi:hypothetical protein
MKLFVKSPLRPAFSVWIGLNFEAQPKQMLGFYGLINFTT